MQALLGSLANNAHEHGAKHRLFELGFQLEVADSLGDRQRNGVMAPSDPGMGQRFLGGVALGRVNLGEPQVEVLGERALALWEVQFDDVKEFLFVFVGRVSLLVERVLAGRQ